MPVTNICMYFPLPSIARATGVNGDMFEPSVISLFHSFHDFVPFLYHAHPTALFSACCSFLEQYVPDRRRLEAAVAALE